ncbi:MAG: hypothetical protein HKN04_02840, partial [Rhodothermaceae bacterium]|nr:hypothetical protein [Rhodothermaceae bacterium]
MTVLTFVLAAIAGWLVVWSGIISLIGWVGWKPMARDYPAQHEPEGKRFTWSSVRIGMSSYNSVLTIVVSAEGFYMKPIRMFAYNHPPILIPWSAVQAVEPGLFGRVKLRLDNGKTLSLWGRIGKAVQQQLDWLDTEPIETMEAPR